MSKLQTRTALGLFKEFQPRFREIAWNPHGFEAGDSRHRFYFGPNRYVETWYEFPYIDLSASGLECTVHYRSAKHGAPEAQFATAVWEAILDGPFKGRTFYAHPQRAFLDPYEKMTIKLSYEGEPIRGHHLQARMSAFWPFFVPRDSPEGKAIRAACALEWARAENQELEKRRSGLTSLHEGLEEALAAVGVSCVRAEGREEHSSRPEVFVIHALL